MIPTDHPLLISQQYEDYTPEDQAVWKILFQRQMDVLATRAHSSFLNGLQAIGFVAEQIPNFKAVNERLTATTGFQIVAVPGIVPDAFFFELLANRQFPASTWLRTMQQLDYLEEPDMFHDVFGHLPLLTDAAYCDFLVGLGRLALKHLDNEWHIHLLSRLYWFTIEFGLMAGADGAKIYGAGILSSSGESVYCISDQVTRLPYEVTAILNTPYAKDHFQEVYYLLPDYTTLFDSLEQAADFLGQ